MALSDRLLDKLVCPQCRNKLEYRRTENRLVCASCKLAYRIENDVPVLLFDETEKL
ncbi:MAG TPA: Trm112 family protein [candidate division Zixibacteria bacterium]|nr:Trm112 family protein [candidate division Zixibacteria bacterium]